VGAGQEAGANFQGGILEVVATATHVDRVVDSHLEGEVMRHRGGKVKQRRKEGAMWEGEV
jgi:hypothetical protein